MHQRRRNAYFGRSSAERANTVLVADPSMVAAIAIAIPSVIGLAQSGAPPALPGEQSLMDPTLDALCCRAIASKAS